MVYLLKGWEEDEEEDMHFPKHPPLQAFTDARQKSKTLWLFWLQGCGCRSISTLSKTGSDTKSRAQHNPNAQSMIISLSHFILKLN